MYPFNVARTRACIFYMVFWSIYPTNGSAQSAEELAREFLIQKVCVDPSGKVRQEDPYNCPPNSTLRSLQPGEPLPYNRYDQPRANADNRQLHNSFPVVMQSGQVIVVNTFGHAPFEHYKPALDGYDWTIVRDGWASIAGTRTSRQGATTWFGADCKPYGGWVSFPVAALDGHLIKAGHANVPIGSAHWEKEGGVWPGQCPSHYLTNSGTSWEPLEGFKFGGPDGATVKIIDAIRSIHGFIDTPQKRAIGHLELFYFTRLYGLTRWEVWAFKERYGQDPSLYKKVEIANESCSGPSEEVYNNLGFVRIACRDWTAIEVLGKPEAAPDWPIPDF